MTIKEDKVKKKKDFSKKWYTEKFLNELKNTAYQEKDKNLVYTVKCSPDAVSKYGLDPRMLGGPIGKMAKGLQFVPDFIFKHMNMKLNENNIISFRESCSKISYADCHINGVEITNSAVLASDSHKIPIRIYQNNTCKDTKALLIFIHGGAFVGGTIDPYDECLKMLVDKFSIKALSIDYRLLPENPYPTPYTDCFDVVEYIYNNHSEFDTDKDKIFVCGDSAGGNLAQACSTKFKGNDVIRGQLLLYPTLNIFAIEDEYYHTGLDDFTFEPTQKRLSIGVIRQMQMLTNCDVKQIGITASDEFNSPYIYSAKGNPPTFITAGALDYLKKDAMAWAHKLTDAGVKTSLLIYNGLGHGYINATGVFPQAEDLIDEMGTFINSIINQ